eukprot:555755-Ditylum_brightwellii.AAC.1
MPQGAKRAEILLELMERLYDETEDNNLKPTAACYHGVITGWSTRSRWRARRGDEAKRAEAILCRMRDVA